ncbi:hypothetical protein PDIDSM_4791 [Penicillium digitatum]|nr:hypothetical protein PDIDSM_4791 [Penicillium digitatum]
MVKRKELGDVTMGGTKPEESDSDEDMDMVNVEFEWFDPQPIDFRCVKNLLRQLLRTDAQIFDIPATNPSSEPNPLSKTKSASQPSFSAAFQLLSQPTIPPIGIILDERLINLPSEIVPPMYNMLQEEIAWAGREQGPYTFSNYLVLSKNYEEVECKLDQEESRPQKKKEKGGEKAERFFFIPEDEVIERHALCMGSIDYLHKSDEGHSDSSRVVQKLRIRTKGTLILIEAARFEPMVNGLTNSLVFNVTICQSNSFHGSIYEQKQLQSSLSLFCAFCPADPPEDLRRPHSSQ